MYMTNYFEYNVLEVMRSVTFAAPPTVYLALYISPVTEEGIGTEISYAGYQRKAVTFSSPAPLNGGIGVKNGADVTFAQALQDSGTVVYIGILDSMTAGNMLLYGQLNEAKPIKAGNAPVIRTGELQFWLMNDMSIAFKTSVLNILRGQSLAGFVPYATLYNGSPEVGQGGVELVGGSFARQSVTFSTPVIVSGNATSMRNIAAVEFPLATQNLGTFSYDALCNAPTSGSVIWLKQGDAASYNKGDTVGYDQDALSVTVN